MKPLLCCVGTNTGEQTADEQLCERKFRGVEIPQRQEQVVSISLSFSFSDVGIDHGMGKQKIMGCFRRTAVVVIRWFEFGSYHELFFVMNSIVCWFNLRTICISTSLLPECRAAHPQRTYEEDGGGENEGVEEEEQTPQSPAHSRRHRNLRVRARPQQQQGRGRGRASSNAVSHGVSVKWACRGVAAMVW